MKINFIAKDTDVKVKKFKDLIIGDCFIAIKNQELCLVTSTLEGTFERANAIILSNGYPMYVEPDADVIEYGLSVEAQRID